MTDYLRLAQERAPQAPEEPDNPYLSLAREQQTLQQNRARTVIESALKDDPDLAAERLRLSQTAGLPPDVVQRNFEELRVKERARAVDLVSLAQDSPVLYRQLVDPSFATTSIDDLDTLKNLERAVGRGVRYVMGADGQGGLPSDLAGAAKTVGLGATVGVGKMAYDVAGTLNDLIGWQSGAEAARGTAKRLQGVMDENGLQGDSSTAQAVRSGLQSAGTNLALLPVGLYRGLYVTANQAAATVAGLMAGGVGAGAYNEARDKGRNQLQSAIYAIPQGTFEYVFERIPAAKLFGDLAANTGLLRLIGRQTLSEGWTEQVTTLAQDFNEWMNLNPDKTLGEFIKERPEAAYQTFIATLVGVGVQTSTIKGINKIVEAATDRSLQFDQDLLQQQMQLAAASTLRARSPEQFRTHIQNVVDANEGAKQEVYIDGEVLNQLPAELLAQLPASVREAIPAALETNSTVAIPMADVLTVAPGTELGQILNDNARMRPNSPSRVEAQLTEQYLQQEADRVLQQAADTQAWQQSQERVRQRVLEGLNRLGRFAPAKNEVDATLIAARSAVRASQLGMTPEQFFDKQLLRFEGSRQKGSEPKSAPSIDSLTDDDWTGIIGSIEGPARPDAKNEEISIDDVKLLKKMVIKAIKDGVSTGKPAAQIVDQIEGLTKGGIKQSGIDKIYKLIDSASAGGYQVFDQATLADLTDTLFKDQTEEERKAGYANRFKNPVTLVDGTRLSGFTDPVQQTTFHGYDKNGERLTIRREAVNPDDIVFSKDSNRTADLLRGSLAELRDQALNQGPDDRSLIVTHNLTAANLLHAVKMGGIAVPSLAVTTKDNPLTGFGEITLIGDKDLADPKGYAGTKVFGADVYSPRYPSVTLEFTPNMRKRAEAQLKAGMEATGTTYIEWSEVESEGPRELERNASFLWTFLNSKGIVPDVKRTEAKAPAPEMMPFVESGKDRFDLMQDEAFIAAAWEMRRKQLIQFNEGNVEQAEAELAQEKQRAAERGRFYFASSLAESITTYRRELRDNGKIDHEATRRALEEQVRSNELTGDLEAAAKKFIEDIAPNERIFQGYTNSGNRRYISHTLENVVKILKKELRGGENFNYGVGSLRAKFTPQFKSIDQIRKAKDRLVSKADFEKVKAEIDAQFWEAARAIDGDLSGDTAVAIMEDAAKVGVQRAAKNYGYEISDKAAVQVAEFLTRLRELPTEYFEAKVLREVDLAEFAGAVVPENVDPKVIEALQARGVKDIRTYAKNDEADRAAKIGEFENLFFQGARGQFVPSNNTMRMLDNADLSTFLHESAHYFFENDSALAIELVAKQGSGETLSAGEQQILNDVSTLLTWHGITGSIESQLSTWNGMSFEQRRAAHERTAESFEAYLFEGKAPSIELQPYFRTFRAWLTQVYTSLKQFLARYPEAGKLSDEVRDVFDRMLATDEQIAQAEEAAGMLPDFEATNEAIEALQARSLRDLKWTVKARGRALKALEKQTKELRKGVEAEVRAEVEAQPLYRAMAWLKKGETVDPETGDTIKAEKGYRLSTEALAEMYPETMLGRPDLTGLRGMTGKEGLHPDMVADMFGFESGDQLVRNILDAEPIGSVIEGMTDQRMLERHGDLATPEAREAAANEAVHNEARARSLATELKSQAEMMNQRQDTGRTATNGRAITVNAVVQAAKQFALNLAARRRLKDLKNAAWQHRAAEARAGKRWQQLTAEGKSEEAVQAKRDQLLNNYAAKALQDAQVEVRKTLEFFKRVVKGNDEKIVERGRDPDVVNAMRAMLAAYDVAPRLEKSALAYMETVAKNDPAMYGALKPLVDAANENAKPLTELTLEELRGLTDTLRSMWDLAKRSRQSEIDGNLIDREELEDQLLARMGEIGIPTEIPGERGAITDAQERGIKLQFAKSLLSRVEQWAERLDGKFGGPFLRFVFQPVKEAADRYRAARVDYRKRFTALLENIAPALPPGPIAAPELNYTFGNARDSGAAELLHAILHTGNESNKRKLLLGRGWASENADGTLDTSRWDAFIERMQNEGKITKAHYDFAQGVWDLLEEMKPLAQKAHRDVFGRYFAEVTANEFTTPFGTYRGGYVPAQTDSRLVKDAKLRELAEGENESMAYAFPAAPSGFTKARVEYNQPLLLDLRALGQHMDKVLLFSYMQPAVTDVRRLLSSKRVSYALDRIDPGAYEGMLIPWLNRAAKQVVETPVVGDRKLSRFLTKARSRAGMALMFANLSNTVQQITGFSSAAVKVKPGLLLESTAAFIADPKGVKKTVADTSAYMKDRMLNEVGAMNDAVEEILVNPNLLERGQAWTQRHAYFLQAAVDNTMSPIVWTAAYNQAIAEGQDERDAVRFADGVVRQTQGSTLPEDISRFESGPGYARLFTQFVSYFNMMANTNATAMKQIVDELGLKRGAGKLLYVALAGMLAPIWVAEAIGQAFKGGPEDEEKDGWLDDWLIAVFGMGTLKGITAQIPIVGQAAQLVVNRFNDNPADDKFSLSPAVSLIESAVSTPASVYKAIVEDGNRQKAVRDVAAAATLVTGLPIYAAARPVGYLAGVGQGKTQPTSNVDLARGIVTGTASAESKKP